MELQTRTLRLRPLEPGDAPAYGALLADPRVHPWTVENGPVPPEDVAPRILRKVKEWERGTGACWAVLRDDQFIGYVALHGLGGPRVALSYAIAPLHQRQGHGRAAVEAVLECIDTWGAGEVEARVHLDNAPSARFLSALGFEEVAPEQDPPRRVFRWRPG
jgi:RimJ/RimL family protein N-acetyltransferase